MVVKSSTEYRTIVIVLLGIVILFAGLLLYTGANYIFVAFVSLLLLLSVIRFWIAIGRTFVLKDKGCTVKFLFFERFYKWSEFVTKRIEKWENGIGYRDPYTSGIVFYNGKTKKPHWLKPATFCIFVHPFSFIFVYFKSNTQYKRGDYHCPDIYSVDAEEFLKNMKEWDVNIM